MTIQQKNSWRLRFKLASMATMIGSVVFAGVLAWVGKDVVAFSGIVTGLAVFFGAVFTADYFSKPVDENKNND